MSGFAAASLVPACNAAANCANRDCAVGGAVPWLLLVSVDDSELLTVTTSEEKLGERAAGGEVGRPMALDGGGGGGACKAMVE